MTGPKGFFSSKMKKNIFLLIFFLFFLLHLESCHTAHDVAYMQDLEGQSSITAVPTAAIRLRPEDKVQILVCGSDPELAASFNLQFAGNQHFGTNNNRTLGYTVDSEGNIRIPVLGTVHVAGLNREEIASLIENTLAERNLLKDPVVTVEFLNLAVYVWGDINHPCEIPITRNTLTLPEALSMAGDLAITGKRHNVLVVRQEGDHLVPYRVDLRSSQNLFWSPVYYLQQNDQIYIEPNTARTSQSTVNGRSFLTPAFWISMFTFAVSVVTLITK